MPETWELTGDDAMETIRRTGNRKLLADAFQRLRWSDGFSHSRSLAFMVVLTVIQGLIAVVGVATAFGGSAISDVIVRSIQHAAPGPVADLLTQAASQAQSAGNGHSYLGLIFGAAGGAISATTAMGQLERGLNRMYGVEKDRDTLHKYGFAFLLAMSAGLLITAAFGLLAFGRTIGSSFHSGALAQVWNMLSWPLGVALMASGLALLFKLCPRRRQPASSWLAFGSAVSVALIAVITVGLGVFFRHSASFGQTYGPLAGMVALMLWSLMSSISVFFGAACAAQLEAVRAHAAAPQDKEKVEESEPDAAPDKVPAGAGTR